MTLYESKIKPLLERDAGHESLTKAVEEAEAQLRAAKTALVNYDNAFICRMFYPSAED